MNRFDLKYTFTSLMASCLAFVVLHGNIVFAQPVTEIRGGQLRIVDSSGQIRVLAASSGPNGSHTLFVLHDQQGRQRLQFIVYPDDRPPTIHAINPSGQIVQVPTSGSRHITPLAGGGKGDDFRSLQNQIDELRIKLNEVIASISTPR